MGASRGGRTRRLSQLREHHYKERTHFSPQEVPTASSVSLRESSFSEWQGLAFPGTNKKEAGKVAGSTSVGSCLSSQPSMWPDPTGDAADVLV